MCVCVFLSATGKKTQKSSSAAKPKRTKKGEAAAQAALEHAKKYGIAVIPIRMSLLFAGKCVLP